MRTFISLVSFTVGLCAVSLEPVWAWDGKAHQQMVDEALKSVKWLDGYGQVKVTRFEDMVRDVFKGLPEPVSARDFKFLKARTREEKRTAYLQSTASMEPAEVRSFAQHLLLSNAFTPPYRAGDKPGSTVNLRQVIVGSAAAPDSGMDKGLNAAWYQGLMGGTDPEKTSSQGFRHMRFLGGLMGQAPQRAQRYFDLAQKAFAAGHPYWGGVFAGMGTHYIADMGAPVHTNILPTLKYVRLKGMFRPKDQNSGAHFNSRVVSDIVQGSANINANYHFLYENMIERAYTGGDNAVARRLSHAVEGKPETEGKGFFSRLLAPRTVEQVASRRARSSWATPSIARNTIRYLTDKFRKPADGAPANTVRSVTDADVEHAVAHADTRRPDESQRQYQSRMAARDRILARTETQFRKNGMAIRQAIDLLHRGLSRPR